jgi:hypothetical protein
MNTEKPIKLAEIREYLKGLDNLATLRRLDRIIGARICIIRNENETDAYSKKLVSERRRLLKKL